MNQPIIIKGFPLLIEKTAYDAVVAELDKLRHEKFDKVKEELLDAQYELAQILEVNGHISATPLGRVVTERDQLLAENDTLRSQLTIAREAINNHIIGHCPKSYNQSSCTWMGDYDELKIALVELDTLKEDK